MASSTIRRWIAWFSVTGFRSRLSASAEPTYPPDALAQRVEGFVMIALTVGTVGRVTDAQILHSIPLLDQAALAAVRRWQYEPRSMTRPVVARVMVPFLRNFTRTAGVYC